MGEIKQPSLESVVKNLAAAEDSDDEDDDDFLDGAALFIERQSSNKVDHI